MLSPAFMMLSIARWEKRLGTDVSRALYAEPVELACWAEVQRGCGGNGGVVFLPAGYAPSPGDRLTVEGEALFVKAVTAYPTHVECETA